MPTTTANGLPATAVRGVPNTWIVREARMLYWAITTDGTPIGDIDTDMTVRDNRWSIVGTVTRTNARDYDTAEEGRELAGWYVELHGNSGERYRRADEALRILKLLIVNDHAEQQARRAARQAATDPRFTGIALIDERLDRFEEFVRAADITGDTVFTPIRQNDWPLIEAMVNADFLRDLEDGDYDLDIEAHEWLRRNPQPAQEKPATVFEIRGRRFGEGQDFIVGRCNTLAEAQRDVATIARLAAGDPSIQHTKRWIVEVPAQSA